MAATFPEEKGKPFKGILYLKNMLHTNMWFRPLITLNMFEVVLHAYLMLKKSL